METAPKDAYWKQRCPQSRQPDRCIESAQADRCKEKVADLMQANALLKETLRDLQATMQAERDRAYQQQNMLLGSVNAATRCLVTHSEVSAALPAVLKILGEGTQQSRAYILKNFVDPCTGEMAFDLEVEWDALDIPTKRETGGQFPVPISLFPERLTTPLKSGESTQFLARDLDGLTTRPAGQALSLLGVPISVNGEWWGLLGLDDCEFERVWSEAEIAVLETAAASIGGALEREQTRRERETAAQARQIAEQNALLSRERALSEERNRMAREIHDTLAQTFTGVSLQLEAAKGILEQQPDTARLYINHASSLARRGLSEARRSVQALRAQALENDTLPTVLQAAVQELTQNSLLEGSFQLIGRPYELSAEVQTNLLRISQEAITNTLRHAEARHIAITLTFLPEQVALNIKDDGRGCGLTLQDPEIKAALGELEGFGLIGMSERALSFGGQFSFASPAGQGTLIEVTIPAVHFNR